jgi:hypothetical protein
VLLREEGLQLHSLQDRLEQMHRDITKMHAKKNKSKLGAFLSELNRKRKARRKSKRGDSDE